jgi:hypothetical protein
MEMAARDYPELPLTLSVHPSIRDLILYEGRAALEDLEKRLQRPIAIVADESLHLEACVIEPGPPSQEALQGARRRRFGNAQPD